MQAIEAHALVHTCGDFTAVDGVSFSVNPGEVFGFLGPNGAGKTTTIGMIFQDPSLDDRLTGQENMRFHAMLYDVPRDTFAERAAELLAMVDLTDKAREPVMSYSGGMKRRLEIARGLLHHPGVLFLDEPTIGLDPQTRRHIWTYLLKLREQKGVTMFMTTHYMDEAEHCDRIAIIDHGQPAALGFKNSVNPATATEARAGRRRRARTTTGCRHPDTARSR